MRAGFWRLLAPPVGGAAPPAKASGAPPAAAAIGNSMSSNIGPRQDIWIIRVYSNIGTVQDNMDHIKGGVRLSSNIGTVQDNMDHIKGGVRLSSNIGTVQDTWITLRVESDYFLQRLELCKIRGSH